MKIFTPKFIWMIWIPIWIQFFSYKILLCTPRFYKLKFIEKNYTQKICTPKFCTQILHAWVGFQFEFNFFIQNIALLEFLHIKFYVYKVSMYIFPCIKFIYSNMSFYFFVFFWKVLHMERGHHDRTWAIAHYRLIFHMVVYSLGEK